MLVYRRVFGLLKTSFSATTSDPRKKTSETVTPANSCGAVANVPIPKDPWCWNIYQPVGIIWKITLGVNVGKYSSTMDPLGMVFGDLKSHRCCELLWYVKGMGV